MSPTESGTKADRDEARLRTNQDKGAIVEKDHKIAEQERKLVEQEEQHAANARLDLWKAAVVNVLATASTALAALLFETFGQQAARLVSNPYILVGLGLLGVAVAGSFLFMLRERRPGIYGSIEVGLSLFLAATALSALKPQSIDGWSKVIGALYFFIRGLDNIAKSSKKLRAFARGRKGAPATD